MNASSLTLSSFEHCHYQIGRTDSPEIQARGVIQITMAEVADAAWLEVTLAGSRRHQRVTVSVPLTPADLAALIRQLQGMHDMLRANHGGQQHGA